MSARPSARSLPLFVIATAIVAALAHVAVNVLGPYGFHRDEFLYLAMGERLQLWRMDFPPFIAIVANVQRALFGDALWSVRLFPAITGSLLLLAAVHAANRFRAASVPTAGEHEQHTAPLLPHMVLVAMLASGVFMRPPNMFQPVIFDQLWWTLALLALLERVHRNDPRWWIGVGAALGFGLLTKFSIAFIGVGIVVGVLLTPLRTDLLTRWPWLALLLALIIGSPSLVGQVALDWPITWQMRDLAAEQLGRRSLLAFLGDQFGLVGPLGIVFAAGGWWWLMRSVHAQRYRVLGIATALSWLLLIAQRGKGYYGAPVYPLLFAAAAAGVSGWLTQASDRSSRRRTVMGLMGANVLLGVIGLPLTLPIASPAFTAAYAQKLGATEATRTNAGTLLALPQDYADMLGWEEQVRAVAEEWGKLSEAERGRAVLAASNYGRAGALDFYGPRYGLPRVVSGAGSYWYFGPGTRAGELLIVLGGSDELKQIWRECRVLRTVGSPWAVEEEQRVEIWRCERPVAPLQEVWAKFDPA